MCKQIVKLFLIGLIFSFAFAYGQVKAASRSSQRIKMTSIKFEDSVYDFNEVSPLSSNSCTFRFHNNGTNILKITNIKTNCGCTVAELDKKEYAPGERGEIKATFNAPSNVGATSKTVYIMTNDPNNKTVY